MSIFLLIYLNYFRLGSLSIYKFFNNNIFQVNKILSIFRKNITHFRRKKIKKTLEHKKMIEQITNTFKKYKSLRY